MTLQEILEKYNATIEQNIQNLMSDSNLTDTADKQRIAEVYKAGFIQGFQEGIQEGIGKGKPEGMSEAMIKVAINMLQQGLSIQNIVAATGLSAQDIRELKGDF
jgi:predicted transposase/invertase (TIGR01784 family)